MSDKNVNYTDAQALDMKTRYVAAESTAERKQVVEELAHEFGKNVKSIRAKLVSLKVYIAAPRKSKSGEKPETKEGIVTGIASILNVNVEQLQGLEKATKAALNLIRGEFVAAAEALRIAYEDEETEGE